MKGSPESTPDTSIRNCYSTCKSISSKSKKYKKIGSSWHPIKGVSFRLKAPSENTTLKTIRKVNSRVSEDNPIFNKSMKVINTQLLSRIKKSKGII
jgi:hypothetical protein